MLTELELAPGEERSFRALWQPRDAKGTPLAAGPYRAFIGLYNETTGQRLPVPTDVAGRVILDVR